MLRGGGSRLFLRTYAAPSTEKSRRRSFLARARPTHHRVPPESAIGETRSSLGRTVRVVALDAGSSQMPRQAKLQTRTTQLGSMQGRVASKISRRLDQARLAPDRHDPGAAPQDGFGAKHVDTSMSRVPPPWSTIWPISQQRQLRLAVHQPMLAATFRVTDSAVTTASPLFIAPVTCQSVRQSEAIRQRLMISIANRCAPCGRGDFAGISRALLCSVVLACGYATEHPTDWLCKISTLQLSQNARRATKMSVMPGSNVEHVLQADRGDFDFLVGCRGAVVTRESH